MQNVIYSEKWFNKHLQIINMLGEIFLGYLGTENGKNY